MPSNFRTAGDPCCRGSESGWWSGGDGTEGVFTAIIKCIEGFDNHHRLHSGIDYQTPMEIHHEYLNHQLAGITIATRSLSGESGTPQK